MDKFVNIPGWEEFFNALKPGCPAGVLSLEEEKGGFY